MRRFYAYELKETPVPPSVMELLADVFIHSVERDTEKPAYSEKQIDVKMKLNRNTGELICMPISEEYMEMNNSSIDAILDSAGLTECEKSVWHMHQSGYSRTDIAKKLELSNAGVKKQIRSALYKLSKLEDGSRGLNDVYNESIIRSVYHQPSHCVDQPCRRLGYCRYAHLHKRWN